MPSHDTWRVALRLIRKFARVRALAIIVSNGRFRVANAMRAG